MASQAFGTSLALAIPIGLSARSLLNPDIIATRVIRDPTPQVHARLIDILLDDFGWNAAHAIDLAVSQARLALWPDDDIALVAPALGFAPSDEAFRLDLKRNLTQQLLDEVGLDTEGQSFGAYTPVWLDIAWGSGSVEIGIDTISFRSGSLLSKIRAVVTSQLFLPTLLAAAATPPAALYADHLIQEKRIERVYRDSPCKVQLDFDIDRAQLRRLAVDQLDWNAPGIDDWERRLRICRIQFALRIVGHTPGRLDGLVGPDTQDAWRRYARAKNFEGRSFGDRIVLDSLAFDAAQVRLN